VTSPFLTFAVFMYDSTANFWLYYQRSTVGVFAKQPVFGQGVSSVVRDSINGTFLHLMLDRLVQHEQGGGDVLLEVVVHTQRQPVRQQLLDHEFRSA